MRGLYPIVDLGTLQARGIDPLRFAASILVARPRLLQLRAKSATPRVTLAWLRALLPLCRDHGTWLFANDRPDLAQLAGADGVHLGQDDLPLADVRRLWPRLRIGVSTHNLQQLEQALIERPDYVALGPIFPTSSKENPDPVIGMEVLQQAAELAARQQIALVAIGGIDRERAGSVGDLGVVAAVIGGLVSEQMDEVTERALELQHELGEPSAPRSAF